jgi:hypothetical protein
VYFALIMLITATAMANRDQLTITLRARWSGDDKAPGVLLASPKDRVVYRVLEVWRVRWADDHGYGFRLVCARRSRGEVPEDATVQPWPRDPRAPRQSRGPVPQQRFSTVPDPPKSAGARLDRIRAKTPLLLALATEPIRHPTQRQRWRSSRGHVASVAAWWSEAKTPRFGWRSACCVPTPRLAVELLMVWTDGGSDA